jgi:hypothetical protein
MNFKHLTDLPKWTHDFYAQQYEYPVEYVDIVRNIRHKADEVFKEYLWKNVSECPITQGEVDRFMNADDAFYETYKILSCNKDTRPDEWNYFYDSIEASHFHRGGIYETKIGEWYFITGFDHD